MAKAWLTAGEARQRADDLEEILAQMQALLGDARRALEGSGLTESRAKSYWVAQIAMALNDEHEYVGSCGATMQGSINELRDEGRWGADEGDD
jgi:hypothetical protein